MIIPAPRAADATEEALLDRTWPTVEHARALGRLGVEVTLILDGPRRREVTLGDATARFVPAAGPSMHSLVLAAVRTNPDILHLFNLRNTSAALATAAFGGKIVAEYNGGTPTDRPWLRRMSTTVSSRWAAIVFTAAEIAGPFYEARALSVRPALAELPEISSRLPYESNRDRAREVIGMSGDPLVLVVGRREAPKDPHVSLDAFLRIAEARPGARLLWASWHGDAEQDRIARDDRIRVERFDDPSSMSAAYAAADVMLHPSRREICGTSYVEALQNGCPIAASDIPAFRRNAVDGAVRLCPVGDANAFASAALELAADSGARDIARAHFDDQLSFDAIAKRRLALYRSL